jgi:hypothetical protein
VRCLRRGRVEEEISHRTAICLAWISPSSLLIQAAIHRPQGELFDLFNHVRRLLRIGIVCVATECLKVPCLFPEWALS